MKIKRKLVYQCVVACILMSGITSTVYAKVQTNKPIITEEKKVVRIEVTKLIEPQYDECLSFEEGVAPVRVGDKWGFINTKGEMIVKPQYDFANVFNEGKAIVVKEEQLESGIYNIGFIDIKGKYTPFLLKNGDKVLLWDYYTNGKHMFHNEHVIIQYDDTNGMFNTSGKIVPITIKSDQYSYPMYLYAPNDGMLGIRDAWLKGEWDCGIGYINEKGELIDLTKALSNEGTGKRIVDIRPFNNGLAPVKQAEFIRGEMVSSAWGVIDKTGKFVIQPQYTDFWVNNIFTTYELFVEDIAIVANKDKVFGAIDKTGKTVIPFKYEVLQPVIEGRIVFKENGKYGYMDKRGKVVIPASFEKATHFSQGIAAVLKKGEAYCIDKEGNKVQGSEQISLDSYYKENGNAISAPEEYIIVKSGDKYGFNKINIIRQ